MAKQYREHRAELEPSPRRVRTVFNGEVVADSRRMMLLHETGRVPVYYFPADDVRMELLQPSATAGEDPKGAGAFWHVSAGGRTASDAAFTFRGSPETVPGLAGYIAFVWHEMDAWFEEDDEVFVHARDPYKRIDVLNGSRQLTISLDGAVLAESSRPRLLFETGMPTRYYLPREDCRHELLEPSEKITSCPYKGDAHYYSIRIGDTLHENLVWSYRFPTLNCARIEGLLCFFNEKTDMVEDGQPLERPGTPWS